MIRPAHVPVLRDRVLALLAPALAAPDAVIVDATVGLGGHAEAVLSEFPAVRLVGLDRDPDAVNLSAERLAPFGERVTLVHAVFDAVPEVLARAGLRRVRGILFDLGVSSMQLDHPERGFAYARDVALDMRMDRTTGMSAADVLNTYPADELARVLRDHGEERFARRIADAVVRERRIEPFATSGRLVELIRSTIPAPARRTGGNPAKRTFQARRIEVNGELATLERALPRAIDALSLGGRIVVLSYHSLEDRLVKRAFAAAATTSAPPGLPAVPTGHEPVLRVLTRGAEVADEREVAANPRAKPVRLRAAERIREAA
jgi:16S rRNA (cytosine1402-N4)-methyltransferase